MRLARSSSARPRSPVICASATCSLGAPEHVEADQRGPPPAGLGRKGTGENGNGRLNTDYSYRSASVGSTKVALRAGRYAARNATSSRRTETEAKVTRSVAPVP